MERYVRGTTKIYKNVYVCTGPLYLPHAESDGKNYVKYQVIGSNNVAVPTHFFKILVGETADLTLELEKKKLALCKSEQLEGLKITKFNGNGDNKFLHYYSFHTEFTELVLDKQYSDSTKLRYLKQYLEGEALDCVKNYHSETELSTALNALDNQYGRAEMVIR